MKFSPTPQKKEAGFVSGLLLLLSIVSFMFSGIDVMPTLPLQLISLVCAVAGVYVATRYIFTSFTYSIEAKNRGALSQALSAEDVDFCVAKTQGSRPPVTECRLSLDTLTKVQPYSDSLISGLRQKHGKVALYHYTASMISPKRHALIFDDRGECICVVIEADERFINTLSSYIRITDAEI